LVKSWKKTPDFENKNSLYKMYKTSSLQAATCDFYGLSAHLKHCKITWKQNRKLSFGEFVEAVNVYIFLKMHKIKIQSLFS
jgi:hypothetical protein